MRSVWSGLYAVVPVLLLACAAFATGEKPPAAEDAPFVHPEGAQCEDGDCPEPPPKDPPTPPITIGPGSHAYTGAVPEMIRVGACPALRLTDNYAITVAHCADSMAPSFDSNNRATITGQTIYTDTEWGANANYYNRTVKIQLHETWPVGGDAVGCLTGETKSDIALLYFYPDIGYDGYKATIYADSDLTWSNSQTNCKTLDDPWMVTYRNDETSPHWKEVSELNNGGSYSACSLDGSNVCGATSSAKAIGSNLGTYPENGDSGGSIFLLNGSVNSHLILVQAGASGMPTWGPYIHKHTTWIKQSDTKVGGPGISSWGVNYTMSNGQVLYHRYFTDANGG